MHSLHELQTTFAAAILERDLFAIESFVCGDDGQDRLTVYVGNVYHNLREALRDVYPVVERLVGKPFFEHAADRYIRENPSQCGDIQRFGHTFPTFLAGYPPAASLRYLADTATLEWLVHEVFHAADHAPLALSELASLAGADCATLRFRLHPACRLLASPFPVSKIWQLNQPEANSDDTIDASAGGDLLLIRRVGFAIGIQSLAPAEFAMLKALHEYQTVDDAYEIALQEDPAFALGECIERRIRDSVIVGFEL
ncbi:DUF2063 domain-containing protein [Paraburkholderia terrae]|uniref:HvfC/BufC N-terminal domain-containing protein n=1 Tax=Paraburkholderia terrae TaxID=311230 RepID=UPI001EE310E8|nr:DNA-binding domain-containing protein [Paraburkholderia terrae]GJH06124.1 DNA-binding domain-containing protein [Paraburkholderia terrae]